MIDLHLIVAATRIPALVDIHPKSIFSDPVLNIETGGLL